MRTQLKGSVPGRITFCDGPEEIETVKGNPAEDGLKRNVLICCRGKPSGKPLNSTLSDAMIVILGQYTEYQDLKFVART